MSVYPSRPDVVIVKNKLTGNRQHMDRATAEAAEHVEILEESAYGPNGRLKILVQKPKTDLRPKQAEAASKPVQPKGQTAPKTANNDPKE